jgi:hypothetical protein
MTILHSAMIAEILLRLALNTNQSINTTKIIFVGDTNYSNQNCMQVLCTVG